MSTAQSLQAPVDLKPGAMVRIDSTVTDASGMKRAGVGTI
jgi:hypothetical protein